MTDLSQYECYQCSQKPVVGVCDECRQPVCKVHNFLVIENGKASHLCMSCYREKKLGYKAPAGRDKITLNEPEKL